MLMLRGGVSRSRRKKVPGLPGDKGEEGSVRGGVEAEIFKRQSVDLMIGRAAVRLLTFISGPVQPPGLKCR